MRLKLIMCLAILTSINLAQDDYEDFYEIEKDRYIKILGASKFNYPGDTRIDVTYYGLDFKITYQPNYLIGTAAINVRVDTTTINSLFLDLSSAANSLVVDSILLNGLPLNFIHNDNKLEVILDRTYNFNEILSVNVYYQGLPFQRLTGIVFSSVHIMGNRLYGLSVSLMELEIGFHARIHREIKQIRQIFG